MTPIQQMLLGVGGAKKTYMDDVFSTYIYQGNGSARSINNGINLSGEGGLVWMKSRTTNGWDNILQDTVRGTGKYIKSNENNAQIIPDPDQYITSFNANGFSLGTENDINHSSQNFASWSFRKAPGFFDVVTYTGNGTSGRTINHSLGSVPGMIMIKKLNAAEDWVIYHRGTGNGNKLYINRTDDIDGTSSWNYTTPTSTTITFSSSGGVNGNNDTYVAYLFAGGESTASTARSVDFDGSGNEALTIPYSSDIDLSTGDWTIECWAKPDDTDDGGGVLLSTGGGNGTIGYESCMFWLNDLTIEWYVTGVSGNHVGSFIHNAAVGDLQKGQWSHVAATREGNTFRFFLNGTLTKEFTNSSNLNAPQYPFHIGGRNGGSAYNGLISNFRLVKGTAVYTSSFRPPTEPLTNITNTKILCCNNSSVTGSTVTSGTITSQGNAAASTDSPFDDPAGFVFGDAGDQNVIKCGSFIGNASTDGPEINLGFEPQWILTKNASASDNWMIFDAMRGIISGGDDAIVKPNANSNEAHNYQHLDITPNGFKIKSNNADINGNNQKTIYVAIRRPDGYVGKLPELGTSVFAMDGSAGGSGSKPALTSSFTTDYALVKNPAATEQWYSSSRLTGDKFMDTSATTAESTGSYITWDTQTGAHNGWPSTYQGWMWKRHAGFDVVTYTGNSVAGRQIPHSLNKTPEMMWVKQRNGTALFQVYHKGLNGGTNPGQYYIKMNNEAEEVNSARWNNTSPTSTVFTVGTAGSTNSNNDTYIAMLFTSVDGVSKVGSFDGSGSTGNAQNIGFQPRFLLIKRSSSTGDWMQFNSVGGFGNYMQLNTTQQQNSQTYVNVSSTGFSLVSDYGDTNESGSSYIYYAHA